MDQAVKLMLASGASTTSMDRKAGIALRRDSIGGFFKEDIRVGSSQLCLLEGKI